MSRVKICHIAFDGLVHRGLHTSNGTMSTACGSVPRYTACDVDEFLTCVLCIVCDLRALRYRHVLRTQVQLRDAHLLGGLDASVATVHDDAHE